MKFSLLINISIVGIFIFISKKISCSTIFSKKEFAIVSNLRIISKTNLISCSAEFSMKNEVF